MGAIVPPDTYAIIKRSDRRLELLIIALLLWQNDLSMRASIRVLLIRVRSQARRRRENERRPGLPAGFGGIARQNATGCEASAIGQHQIACTPLGAGSEPVIEYRHPQSGVEWIPALSQS